MPLIRGGERTPSAVFVEKPPIETGIGILSGAMGMALAMPGPVVVLYLLARHAGKQISRAATLILFGLSYGAVSLVHTLWGGMIGTAGCWRLSLRPLSWRARAWVTTPPATSVRNFRSVVLAVLIVSGLYAMWTSF